ncbi:MAG: hypothetical protein ACMUHX_05065 [bacterium]
MFKTFKESIIFKEKKEELIILFILLISFLFCGVFGKTAYSYYGGEFLSGTWNSPFMTTNFSNPFPYNSYITGYNASNTGFNTNFFNPGSGLSYGTLGRYGFGTGGYSTGFNPGYGISAGYGGFSSGYNPGFGSNYSLFGRNNLFPGSYFSGLGQSYTGLGQGYAGYGRNYGSFYPGVFGMPFFPAQGFYNTPVSSDDPLPPAQNSLDPKPGDENLNRGPVYLNETQLYVLESYPMQVRLQLKGNLPTPCHELRAVVSGPNSQDRINVELYSLENPNLSCATLLEPFDETISLGSFTGGSYTVWVNGERVENINL